MISNGHSVLFYLFYICILACPDGGRDLEAESSRLTRLEKWQASKQLITTSLMVRVIDYCM